MESKNLVICDPETKFASAFAQYLTRQKELAVRVRTCSDLSYVLAIQEKEKIDFLFISSEYPEDSRKQVKAGMVFVIAPEREVALENREVPIYKYQPGDQILAEMIRQCSMSGDEKQIFLKITGKKNCRVIAVYSPVRRIGKTTYAIRLGRKLAKEANVLYLGMETYGGEGGHFPEGTQTLADVLYYARQEQSNIGTVLTTIVRHSENLDYIVPMPVSEDIKEIDSEEWIRLIQKIIEQSIKENELVKENTLVMRFTCLRLMSRSQRRRWRSSRQNWNFWATRMSDVRSYERSNAHDTGGTASCEDSGGTGSVQRYSG